MGEGTHAPVRLLADELVLERGSCGDADRHSPNGIVRSRQRELREKVKVRRVETSDVLRYSQHCWCPSRRVERCSRQGRCSKGGLLARPKRALLRRSETYLPERSRGRLLKLDRHRAASTAASTARASADGPRVQRNSVAGRDGDAERSACHGVPGTQVSVQRATGHGE